MSRMGRRWQFEVNSAINAVIVVDLALSLLSLSIMGLGLRNSEQRRMEPNVLLLTGK